MRLKPEVPPHPIVQERGPSACTLIWGPRSRRDCPASLFLNASGDLDAWRHKRALEAGHGGLRHANPRGEVFLPDSVLGEVVGKLVHADRYTAGEYPRQAYLYPWRLCRILAFASSFAP